MDTSRTKPVAEKLSEMLGDPFSFVIGVTESEVIIYHANVPKWRRRSIPEQLDGVLIKLRNIGGRPKPCSNGKV